MLGLVLTFLLIHNDNFYEQQQPQQYRGQAQQIDWKLVNLTVENSIKTRTTGLILIRLVGVIKIKMITLTNGMELVSAVAVELVHLKELVDNQTLN